VASMAIVDIGNNIYVLQFYLEMWLFKIDS
jgi:hypothetical protein